MDLQKKGRTIQKKILGILLISAVLFTQLDLITNARRTASDIQAEIDQKQQELTQVDGEISELQKNIDMQKQELSGITGKRATINAQISINNSEIELIAKKLNDLSEQKELDILEKEKRVIRQNSIVFENYTSWKQDNLIKIILSEEVKDTVKFATYHFALSDDEQKGIETIQAELEKIEKDLEESTLRKAEFEKKIAEFNVQIQEFEKQILELDGKIKLNQLDVENYRTKLGEIQSAISELTKEQEEIQRYEASLLGNATNGGTKPLQKGEIYFQGIGRDAYQGHGVGMSQFGALGAALKGWDYKDILRLYYPNTTIATYEARDQIRVDGYGSMGVEDYVAGAGEIPDYSCEELGISFDKNNIWKCWPEEAIKAQVVAFRSYGISKTQDGSSICTSARCQVYKGGDNKRWAAEETEHEVVMYDGQPISAFYSSDNHNGWGTADNDTVWSNMDGVGVPKPYLRAVNDEETTYPYVYTYWTWRTNSYTIEEIDEMLNWSITSKEASGSYKNFLEGVLDEIGILKEIRFESDPSGRVKRVKLIGSDGSRYIAGWLFKSTWNIWVANEEPSGEEDFIYSLTYYKLIAD